jgi:guanine deaminase
MRRALALAEQAVREGRGGPFGAVVVKDGEVVGEGANAVTSRNDPTAHAEVEAIRAAGRGLGSFVLAGCDLYTSCEPCPMCLAAAYWARLDRIFYANTRADAARIGFDDAVFYEELASPPELRRVPARRVELPEALAAFELWLAKPDRLLY